MVAKVPTKTLTFPPEVIAILRDQVTWENDGKLAKMPQLDRETYLKVNKALTAMGGVWTRSLGGHVFPKDPRSTVTGLIEDGALVIERDGFFETPVDVAKAMTWAVTLGGSEPMRGDMLEPSAGKGAIIRVVKGLFPDLRITAVERNKERADFLRSEFAGKKVYVKNEDFLEKDYPADFSYVMMNPPFENLADVDHVMHAFEFVRRGGLLIAIMSDSGFFRDDKKAVKFRAWLEKYDFASGKMEKGIVHAGVQTRMILTMKH